MKNDQIHKLSYKHWIFSLGFIGLLALIFIPSWNHHREQVRLLDAKRHAEVLGYQLFEIYGEASRNTYPVPKPGTRAPASIPSLSSETEGLQPDRGSIGNDPWGQPYRYKIVSAKTDRLKVQIWSAGPNKKFETNDIPDLAAESYLGDDVGVVLSMLSPTTQEISR